ncbi:protein of unknown function DUF820 [Thalassoporum mexicanum PCC 7367]|uniref:Uma2 family endonuclease n=1 Tax=Thalassoporum mexicanum TaxID=3457544 RepID=UPI00029FA8DF|nr:Uma2 family endonuclease [Pseudanabaena sp. PCC 7367]AFY70105.1 protein of unknown function DUF820 [Pseudanabaena sp. PCC 7367]
MTATLPIAHFSITDYHRMIEAGIIGDRRIELINGLLVEMSPEGVEHTYFEENLAKQLEKALAGKAYVRENKPITLADSEPEPDIAVVKLPRSQYLQHHPFAEHILLVVEVAKSSLPYDRTIKKELYAQANIPEYWLVDLQNRRVMVWRSPQGKTYQTELECNLADLLSMAAFPKLSITVASIFAD